jgi:hypothetical protein
MFLSPSGQMTPVQAESERLFNEIHATSHYGRTPAHAAESCRSAYAFTPGYQPGFSPHELGSPANCYASPAHLGTGQPMSPGYGSPLGLAGASPIYTGANMQSPAYNAQSPIYQPHGGATLASSTNQRHVQSPQYSPNALSSPRMPPDGQKPYSPVYHPPSNIGKSPAYSPTGIGGRVAAPSPLNPNQQSPAYSPSSLGKSLPHFSFFVFV